jgi:hypothetical protein
MGVHRKASTRSLQELSLVASKRPYDSRMTDLALRSQEREQEHLAKNSKCCGAFDHKPNVSVETPHWARS